MRSKISTSPAAVVFKGGKASLMRATSFNDSFTTSIAVSPILPVFWWLTGTLMGAGGQSGLLREPRSARSLFGWLTCAGDWETTESESWSLGADGARWLDGERLRKILRNRSLVRGFSGFNDMMEVGRGSQRKQSRSLIEYESLRMPWGCGENRWPLTDIGIWCWPEADEGRSLKEENELSLGFVDEDNRIFEDVSIMNIQLHLAIRTLNLLVHAPRRTYKAFCPDAVEITVEL